MELETDDPIKGQLLERASRHRSELEEEVNIITERTEKVITNALLIGGALALTYFLVRQLSDSKPKSKKSKKAKPVNADFEEEESIPNPLTSALTQIGTTVASQATVFLLDLAKEKLAEFLQSQAEKKNA
jgi:hypothetical protein